MRVPLQRCKTPKTQLPYILSDVANDLTLNGVLDTEKFTERGQKWIEEGLVEDNQIIPVAGIKSVPSSREVGLNNSANSVNTHPLGNTELNSDILSDKCVETKCRKSPLTTFGDYDIVRTYMKV